MIISIELWGVTILNHSRVPIVRRANQVVIILGCIAIGVGLGGYIYMGSFMRYSGDDYCYGAILTTHGFWDTQVYAYLNQVPFHGNRFSLTLFSSIAGLFRPSINGALPGLAIVLWVTGLYFAFKQIFRTISIRAWPLETLLISEFMVFITLYAAPDLPESLYWRSGMLPYLAPIIVNLFLISLIIQYTEPTHPSPFLLVLIILTALAAGGFSETAASVQLGYIFLWAIWKILRRNGGMERVRTYLKPLVAAGFGTAVAMLLLISSPSTQPEVVGNIGAVNVFDSFSLSALATWNFILGSMNDIPLPHLLVLLFFTGLSFLRADRRGELNNKRAASIIKNGLMALFASFSLIFLCMFPSTLVRSVIPNPRALIIARFIVVSALAIAGWLLGNAAFSLIQLHGKQRAMLNFGILAFLVLLWSYPVRAANNTVSGVEHFKKWAAFWDLRDENIREAKSRGLMDLEVMHLDKVIHWVSELSPDPGGWYNICASSYYAVESISATIPVWDE